MNIKKFHTLVFDFDGVFTNNYVYVDSNANEYVQCDRRDGLGFNLFRKYIEINNLSLDYFILSTEANVVVEKRASKLKLTCYQKVMDKYDFINSYLQSRHPQNSQPMDGVIYVGNDLNDLKIIQAVGYSICPSDSHQRVLESASMTLPTKGGDCFVRNVIEYIIDLPSLSDAQVFELLGT